MFKSNIFLSRESLLNSTRCESLQELLSWEKAGAVTSCNKIFSCYYVYTLDWATDHTLTLNLIGIVQLK